MLHGMPEHFFLTHLPLLFIYSIFMWHFFQQIQSVCAGSIHMWHTSRSQSMSRTPTDSERTKKKRGGQERKNGKTRRRTKKTEGQTRGKWEKKGGRKPKMEGDGFMGVEERGYWRGQDLILIMLDRYECFSVFHHLQKDKQHTQRHLLKLGKKRQESSKRNYYIISPRVIIKAIVIILIWVSPVIVKYQVTHVPRHASSESCLTSRIEWVVDEPCHNEVSRITYGSV